MFDFRRKEIFTVNPLRSVFVSALLLAPVVCSSAPAGSSSGGADGTATNSAGDSGAIKLAKAPQPDTKSAAAFQHIVIIFQENRTPDNLFHDPVLISRGADIASSGQNSQGPDDSANPD